MSTASTIIANVRALAQRNGEVDKRLMAEVGSVSDIVNSTSSTSANIASEISSATLSVNTAGTTANDALSTANTAVSTATGSVQAYVVSAPVVTGSQLILGKPSTFTATAAACVNTAALASFKARIVGVGQGLQTFNATNGTATITLTLPEDAAVVGDTVNIEVFSVDSLGNYSARTVVACSVVAICVNVPTILTPINNATIIISGGLTVSTDTFSTSGGSDTHANSSYKICSDAAGNNVVLSVSHSSSSKTSHTFSSSDLTEHLTPDAYYYVFAQHTGTTLGDSSWSAGVMFQAKTGVVVNGFKLYRSANGFATTIEYYTPNTAGGLGTLKKMEVADARYRYEAAAWGTYGTNTSLTNFTTQGNNGWYITGGTPDTATSALPNYSNSDICNQWRNLSTDASAKDNCDVWITYKNASDTTPAANNGPITGVPAVSYVRNLVLDSSNGTWDIPNEFQLIVIYALSDILDTMDPTATTYTSKKLGYTKAAGTGTLGRFGFGSASGVWSSTEYTGDTSMRIVTNAGYCIGIEKYATAGVIPVRELA